MTIGSRLRKARENKKLSQLEVSKLTNINNKTLSRYENDGAEPDFDTLRKLADLYDVPVSYFFGEIDYSYDLKELLADKELMWEGKKLSENEKDEVIGILDIILKRMKDTTN